jgi:TPR repeat protein
MTGPQDLEHAYALAEGFVDTGRYAEAGRLIAGLLSRAPQPDLDRLRQLLTTAVGASEDAAARLNLALVLLHEDADASEEECELAIALLQEVTDLTEDPGSGQYSRTMAGLAHGLLGDACVAGHGTPADAEAGFRHYCLAAEHGNTKAALNVALALDAGMLDQPVDKHEAARYYRIAADGGEARAMTNLALLYLNDIDPPDEVTVVDLLEQARDQGDPNAGDVLDALYRDTLGDAGDPIDPPS